jgi:putative iron-dependent peroxidase
MKINSMEYVHPTHHAHVLRMRDSHKHKIPIVRQSLPFGTASGEHGLLFVAYANDVHKFETLLDRMVGKHDGYFDSVLRFSSNSFGNYFYMPSKTELRNI